MNQEQFKKAANVSAELAARWFSHISAALKEFGITSPTDIAMFIAQVGHESTGFTRLVENLNYSAASLVPTFGKHRITEQQAAALGRTAIPGDSTLTKPPVAKTGHAVCWDGSAWQQVIDLRGNTAYETKTGAAVAVKILGPLAAGLTIQAPTTPYDKWDGAGWVTDAAAAQEAAVQAAEAQRAALLAAADAIMLDWRTELALGEISDDDRRKLSLWLDYKKQVKAVDVSTAYSWPKPPAQ